MGDEPGGPCAIPVHDAKPEPNHEINIEEVIQAAHLLREWLTDAIPQHNYFSLVVDCVLDGLVHHVFHFLS